jgi:hypothetical protein
MRAPAAAGALGGEATTLGIGTGTGGDGGVNGGGGGEGRATFIMSGASPVNAVGGNGSDDGNLW